MIHYYFNPNMMYYYNYGLWNPFGFILSIIGWILIVFLIIWVIRSLRGPRHWRHLHDWYRDPAMDTLRERYARGEINKEEFEVKRKDLERGN